MSFPRKRESTLDPHFRGDDDRAGSSPEFTPAKAGAGMTKSAFFTTPYMCVFDVGNEVICFASGFWDARAIKVKPLLTLINNLIIDYYF